jgi:biotin carboxylase
MPRVLLFATTTGYQLRSFDEAARTLGVELVFATDRCHQLDDPWRDRAIAVRFHEPEASVAAVAREAARAAFQGVLAVGDRPAMLAALACEALALPGNTADAAAASANKLEARRRFAAAGLNVPQWFALRADACGADLASDPRLEFPCVLKPLGLSGSRGVIRADDREEFAAAYDRIAALLARPDVRAARSGLGDEILVEAFIPGREFAIEGVLASGALQVFTIFDKPDPLDGPFFEETIYLTPSALDVAERCALVTLVENATAALGLRHGPIHAECRVGPHGAFVLEVAARPIGGLCSRALRFTGDVSLEHVLLRHAMGEDVSGLSRESQASGVMMIPIPRRGILKRVDGVREAQAVANVTEIYVSAQIGQYLERLPEAGSYLGFIFARGESPADVDAALREAHGRITFAIDGAIDVVTSPS